MKQDLYIKIKGMSCNSCKKKIEKNLLKLNGVSSCVVNLKENLATLTVDKEKVNNEQLISTINSLGYSSSKEEIYLDKSLADNKNHFIEVLVIAGIIIFIYILLKVFTGFSFLNMIPTINSTTSLSMLFVVGLLTSIHCISMCGGIVLSISKDEKSAKNVFMYNVGRLISYTIIGGIVGYLGSVFTVNNYINFLLVFVSAIFMFLIGLSNLNIIKKRFVLKLPFLKTKTKSPFIIGLINGFMPCGALQSMQLYAVSTGSFILGSASMFLFALGTIPLMFIFGLSTTILKGKYLYRLKIFNSILIILLSLVMFNRAVSFIGIDFNKKDYSNYKIASIVDGYQIIEIDVSKNSYEDIVIQKDIPVKFNLKVQKGNLNGCNNSIIIREWNIKKDLSVGDNIVTFTPNKTGDYLYTCHMNMIKNHILVVDSLDKVKGDK